MHIQVLNFVDADVQDGIIVCGANRYAVGISELFGDLGKLRPVIILWQRYLHIQIRVVEHVWRIIAGLGNRVVVIDSQKFLFEVFFVVYVLGQILRVKFITNIVPSNNLKLLSNHGVKLIEYILSAQRTFLDFCDAIYGGSQHHVAILIQYVITHIKSSTL